MCVYTKKHFHVDGPYDGLYLFPLDRLPLFFSLSLTVEALIQHEVMPNKQGSDLPGLVFNCYP